MADDQQELRRISWTEVFSFTHIFKSFRMAIHPSKLLLALAAVLLVYVSGRALDGIWGLWNGRAQNRDPYSYYQSPSAAHYEKVVSDARDADRPVLAAKLFRKAATPSFANNFAPVLARYGGSDRLRRPFEAVAADKAKSRTLPTVAADVEKKDWDDNWDDYVDAARSMIDRAEDALGEAKDKAAQEIKGITDKSDKEKAQEQLDGDVASMKRAIWMAEHDVIDVPCSWIKGQGPFRVLLKYEAQCFGNVIQSVTRGSFFTRMGALLHARGAIEPGSAEPATAVVRQGIPVEQVLLNIDMPGQARSAGESSAIEDAPGDAGAAAWLFLMGWGLIWMACNYPVYSAIFLVLALAIWAVFGGAVARVAALHAAREEKISISQALRFSIGKFFSFFTAPLIPLAIVVLIGIVLGLGGMLMAIPVVDIIMSVLFFVALILGTLVAFLLLGWLAGSPLMYPTIAVEGSDSFDAISRSYSYVFARPWRYVLYSGVALVYGAICYLFVRLFALLTLLATHFFVNKGVFGFGANLNGAPELSEGASKLDLLWSGPTFFNLGGGMNTNAMSGLETVSSALLHVWVYLVVAMVAAFVLSFCVSSHTIIYYLLRRKVDATDLDDAYVEELEAEEPAEAQSTAPAEPQSTPPVEPTPPAGETPSGT